MARAMSNAQRFDTSVTDAPTVEKAHRLMAKLDAGNADLLRGSLDLLDWCVSQVQEGRQIASVDGLGGTVRELSSPLLNNARRHSRLALHNEAFDQVVRLVEQQAPPTAALRELMAEAYAHELLAPA